MVESELLELERRAVALPAADQAQLIERLARNLRRVAFDDRAGREAELRAMAADPDIQREVRAIDDDFAARPASRLEKAG